MASVTAGEAPNETPVDPWLPPPDDTGTIPLMLNALDVRVARFFPDEEDQYQELDNVRVVEIRREIGVSPGTARLRYIFDNFQNHPLSPMSFEEALSTLANKPKTIHPGDRIVIGAYRPGDGLFKPLFDGEAISFEGEFGGGSESVTILCRGIAARTQDEPIQGALYRDGSEPLAISDTQTDVHPHFNPKGLPNCCPDGDPVGDVWRLEGGAPEGQEYPTFMDPDNTHTGDEAPTLWDLAKAARYICFRHNAGERFVKSPRGAALDAMLRAKVPIEGVDFDADDPDTYDSQPIIVADKPIGGKDWPSTLRDLIADKGFECRWHLASGDDLPDAPEGDDSGDGQAQTRLQLFETRRGARVGARDIFLQARGSAIDLAASNVVAGSFARDLSGVVNDWQVEGDFVEVEATFVLACGFANVPAISVFDPYDRNSPGFADHYNEFRLFILDESGEGHYLPGSDDRLTDVPDLDAVLGKKIDDERTWAIRRRPPTGTLFSKPTGAPTSMRFKHSLAISTDYDGEAEGKCPAVWDGTGTWQPIKGNYELLKDRVGIRITAQNPNAWNVEKSDDDSHPFGSGIVKAIECLSTPSEENPKFYLRLTCVVRRDVRVFGFAARPESSPLPHTVKRVVDAHDRYKRQIILEGSEFAFDEAGPFTEDVLARDDGDACKAEAIALQVATSNGVMGGNVHIPYVTCNYELGDRIRSLYGRGLGFRTDGDDGGYPVYPIVTAIRHTFEPQATELELSDASIARVPYTRTSSRRHAQPPGSRGRSSSR